MTSWWGRRGAIPTSRVSLVLPGPQLDLEQEFLAPSQALCPDPNTTGRMVPRNNKARPKRTHPKVPVEGHGDTSTVPWLGADHVLQPPTAPQTSAQKSLWNLLRLPGIGACPRGTKARSATALFQQWLCYQPMRKEFPVPRISNPTDSQSCLQCHHAALTLVPNHPLKHSTHSHFTKPHKTPLPTEVSDMLKQDNNVKAKR